MKYLRSHILRITVIGLLLSGFGICSLQPVQSGSNSQAFARWLSSMANHTDIAEIRHELDQLKESNVRFDQMLEKASQIVTEKNNKFNFAFQKTVASQVYQFLLIEWNQFKTDNSMANVPFRHSMKLSVPFNLDKIGSLIAGTTVNKQFFPISLDMLKLISEQPRLQISMIPMADGIAIGAP